MNRLFHSLVSALKRLAALRLVLGICLPAMVVAGCSTMEPRAASGAEAYKLVPPLSAAAPLVDYEVGPLDVLTISVFQEKDLSFEEVPVDASGNILFPLIGQITVSGRTTTGVSELIAQRLGDRFLVNPQVTVFVKTSVSQKVTVDGEVKEPGVYKLQGKTSLIQAVAMAKGTTPIARLNEALVFRTIEGTPHVARFDLEAIRKGMAPDPQILASDTVVIGYSRAKSTFRDIIGVAPALASGFVALAQIAQ